MKRALALPVALCGLLSACDPPPKPELLSRARVETIAQECDAPANTIAIVDDKVRFDPPPGMAQSTQACVLKQLRERLPGVAIDYAGGIAGQAHREGKTP